MIEKGTGQVKLVEDGAGVLRFGPDRNLYVVVGDTGRRGQMQNLAEGPFSPPAMDDQFGGPDPDDAHMTGAIMRLDEDGRAPRATTRSSRSAR